ncbi:MAG: biotin/lipoyl-containing protein, partial [Actinomycetota bacterium]
MAEEFVMPKLGLTMESGTIVSWLVEDGADVAAGQPVLVIETDKVESEVEAPGAGRLHQLGVVGEEYPSGEGIGWFLADGEAPPATSGASSDDPPTPTPPTPPPPPPPPAPRGPPHRPPPAPAPQRPPP